MSQPWHLPEAAVLLLADVHGCCQLARVATHAHVAAAHIATGRKRAVGRHARCCGLQARGAAQHHGGGRLAHVGAPHHQRPVLLARWVAQHTLQVELEHSL